MEAQKKWVGAGRFDSINSTYKHKITLDNNYELVGYSKSLLSREAPDKIVLLEKMILRLIKGGYLFGKTKSHGNKTLSIEYFLNGNYQGVPDEKIITLKPDLFIIHNDEYLEDIRLNTFFNRIYTQAKQGNIITKSVVHKSKEDKSFDLTKRRFKNEPELYNFMQLKLREGYPFGEVMNFYHKYKEKFLATSN